MSNTVKILQALSEGRLHEATELTNLSMNESRDQLIEEGKEYVAKSLTEVEDNDEESDGEDDEYDDEDDDMNEAIITKVNAAGEKTKRKKAPKGYKYLNGKLTKITTQENRSRSKGAKRGAKKKVGQKRAIERKSAKAMKKRKSLGVDK